MATNAPVVGQVQSGVPQISLNTLRSDVGSGALQTVKGSPSFNPAPSANNANSDVLNQQTADNSIQQASGIMQQALNLERQSLLQQQAPTLNLNALQSAAQTQAQNSVNPLYTSYMNNYLQGQAEAQANQRSANQLAIQGAQSSFGNTQAQLAQQQQYAGQNTALTLEEQQAAAQNREQNAGLAFDQQRQQLEQQIGSSGMGASGLGQRLVWQARNAANIAETQAQKGDVFNRNSALLNENNTFAQIAQSGKYAATQEAQAESGANLDLNEFLQQSAYNGNQFQQDLSQWKQTALGAATQNYMAQGVTNALQPYSNNPALFQAGLKAYAPYLNTENIPSLPGGSPFS